MKNIVLIMLLFLSAWAVAQPSLTPAEEQSESVLLLGGTFHIGNGDKIEGGALGFRDGIITHISSEKMVDTSQFDRIIHTHDKHIYPGFIAMNSTLGLVEIEAVRASKDHREVGSYNPNVRTIISYNSESDITTTVRTNGVLMGQITPRGGVVSGSSSLVQFDAWNWEDALLEADEGIHVNWPRMYRVGYDTGQRQVKESDGYDEAYKDMLDFFERAQAYSTVKEPEVLDVKFEAMRGLFDGSKTLFVHADDIQPIQAAVSLKKKLGIKKMSIVGGYDSWLVADLLRENNISVVLRRVHELPKYTDDEIDLPYRIPKKLQDEGVLYCLQNAGGMEQMGTRNLPFYAGTAVAYGLTYEQGVQSLTLSPAKILGVDHRLGSLELNKEATLFVSDGDALDMLGNQVSDAFIQGREITLDNRQIQLYKKFKKKYDQQKESD